VRIDRDMAAVALAEEQRQEMALQAARQAMRLTFAQLMIGLVTMQWITEAEGEAWLAGNALPAEVLALIAGLPAEHQFPAKARAMRMTVAERLDPMVLALAAGRGIPAADMDQFFTTFGGV
jgi:uncharacterized membrane protein AbrB (regulator of aidB expression)